MQACNHTIEGHPSREKAIRRIVVGDAKEAAGWYWQKLLLLLVIRPERLSLPVHFRTLPLH